MTKRFRSCDHLQSSKTQDRKRLVKHFNSFTFYYFIIVAAKCTYKNPDDLEYLSEYVVGSGSQRRAEVIPHNYTAEGRKITRGEKLSTWS